jgi:hypothetical protein
MTGQDLNAIRQAGVDTFRAVWEYADKPASLVGSIPPSEDATLLGPPTEPWMCRLAAVNTMQPETKFLRLRSPVTIGSRFDDWFVTWLGGWTRDRLSYIVMVAKIESPTTIVERGKTKGGASTKH